MSNPETLAQRAADVRDALISDPRYALAMAQVGEALDRGDEVTALAIHKAAEAVRRGGVAARRRARDLAAQRADAVAALAYAVAERDDLEAHHNRGALGAMSRLARAFALDNLAAARDRVADCRHDLARLAPDAGAVAFLAAHGLDHLTPGAPLSLGTAPAPLEG